MVKAEEGAAIIASKGLNLPEFVQAGVTLKMLAADLANAEKAFLAAMANYKTSAAVMASAPGKS